MAANTTQIQRYLYETLGVSVSPTHWAGGKRLPLFLRDGYTFDAAEILGEACLFMTDLREEDPSPAKVRKHLDQIRSKWDGEIIYVRRQLPAYLRKRLIDQKVSFLVPGNQMYLPTLGIDLREHFRQLRQATPTLSPATQAVVFYVLLGGEGQSHTPTELAERLGYTRMTMTRAFNELESEELGSVFFQGRQRFLTFGMGRRELWQKALPLIRSPVKLRRSAQLTAARTDGFVAGLSALARFSKLAAPRTPTIAMSTTQWKTIPKARILRNVAADDPETTEIEVWLYDPALFAKDNVVDRLSLFLSLRGNEDERVEASLEEMMEGVSW